MRRYSVNQDGYIVMRIDGKQVLHHRFVMEKHLGRALAPTEVVHHKNGQRSDNRISNLELFESNAKHRSIGHEYEVPAALYRHEGRRGKALGNRHKAIRYLGTAESSSFPRPFEDAYEEPLDIALNR